MNKSEIYNWRLDPELKQRLEAAAQADGISIAGALDRAAREWLMRRARAVDEEKRQIELHALARTLIGRHGGPELYSKEALRKKVLARGSKGG
jgi:hypothetical protein